MSRPRWAGGELEVVGGDGADAETRNFASRRGRARSFAISIALSDQRARGSRAPTAPAVPCAKVRSQRAHGLNHEYSQDIPAFPAQWVYGLYVISPVSGLDCHRCPASTGRRE